MRASAGGVGVGAGVFAGGVVVLAGASGFLIGFGPAAATAGSASSSTRGEQDEGTRGDRISAMIQDRSPRPARGGARDTPSG